MKYCKIIGIEDDFIVIEELFVEVFGEQTELS